jgi:hypothetical protein
VNGRRLDRPALRRLKRRRWGRLLGALLLIVAAGGLGLWFGAPWRGGPTPGPTGRDEPVPPGEDLSVWFASPQEDALVAEKRRVSPGATPVERAKAALQELIAGPTAEAVRTVPREAKVRELFIDGQGTAYVDFSEALSRHHPGGPWAEILTIRSIVHTLATNVPDIQRVQILIEGREVDTLAGHVDIRRPFATTLAIDER